MTSPFNWRAEPSKLGKEFRPRNDVKGALPPILLPNSSKYLPPKMQKREKK